MIDPNKTYQTKSGLEWRYYGESGDGQSHGAYKASDGVWIIGIWTKNGSNWPVYSGDSPLDIVEVKPRIKRTYWLNIYEINIYENSRHDTFAVGTRELADKWDSPNRRLACVKVEIDCEVGEGL